ncbi:MAG: Negative regulator of GroEL, contains thioredoxin-like and TPR-like domains [Chloroflexi bacterium AL-W]|nr:Negative regulator of GroEL, contains thioredoxin-like and TPR-like domains [Chloroflexi bacterium AL-N1]NOK70207.1 Negative regulator of GroEL, contains thioredoxin-like and TPR-like domains [Chloroflexi bacterium AL-N10]NOK77744.1 Negative regulator of GroEL, contains thioredoxin-like and TPR-like domains [Chloroflexi bacterium AL-N5]NOK84753.1 Negative regulator of GroEL, contains thioredoxin-like and TPR-like domains [Chloroflexi bacterium AL-W]NOK93184.1 Negative regulator of GroEL, con
MTTYTPPEQGANAPIIEVDQSNFEREVVARSREVPVVVDFWAPWCGPCRALGPTLERLAEESQGAFVLAKVNVDQNQQLALAFQVQGIPAVKALKDGKIVDEFTGALPERQIREWLKRFMPSKTDGIIEAAAALEATDPDEAIARYRVGLGSDPENPVGLFGLGRLLFMRGEQEGVMLLQEVPIGSPFYSRAQGLLELADFFGQASDVDAATLQERMANDARDLEARYQLAIRYTQDEQYTDALDQLLAIVMRDRSLHDDGARRAMLGIFAMMGNDNEVVVDYQRKLASALF